MAALRELIKIASDGGEHEPTCPLETASSALEEILKKRSGGY
jgi:hypothetical protein